MKWIGEHIWDFISRFRSEVYLEGISSGTPSTFISVDSSKKIVTGIPTIESVGTITTGTWRGDAVATGYGGTGLSSYTQGDILYYNTGGSLSKLGIGSAGEVLKVNSGATAPEWGADASGLSFSGSTSNGLCTYGGASQVDVEANFTFDGDDVTITSATTRKPEFVLKSTTNDNKGSNFKFVSDKGGAGADSDFIGAITFIGDNSAQEQIDFCRIDGKVGTALDTDEAGLLSLRVAASTGGLSALRVGLELTGHGTDDKVDANIGYGSASLTTIAGTLTMGSTAFVNNSGVIQVATQGTIDHDSLANFVAAEHYRWDTDISATATINAANIPTLNQDTTGNATTATTLTAGNKSINGTFQSKGFIQDDDRNLTIGSDGHAIHVDASDMTDGSTSASGTNGTYNHITFENPRLMATNSSVTTTNASTVFIKGAPAASTNQTITNAYALYVFGGDSYFNGGSMILAGGSIELGHATDTTIARSAAGTVTIEGNTIATTNKLIDCKTAGYWSSTTTGGYYITLGGSSTSEGTSLATSSYTAMYVAPYDGKILRITSFHQSSSSRTSTLEVYIDGDDDDLTNDQRGTDMSVSSYGQKFTQDCPADWTFSKGEAIAIKRTDTAAVYGTTMTVVFEYDTTT